LSSLPPSQAFAIFQKNPVGFIQKIVGDAAQYHLAMLKEQAELDGAINAFQKTHPEFQRFQQFILQEAADLLQNLMLKLLPTLLTGLFQRRCRRCSSGRAKAAAAASVDPAAAKHA